MTPVKRIYLSFDLGLRGDYDGLYAWLDKYKAKECGAGLALLDYPDTGTEFMETLEKELLHEVAFDNNDRLYVVWRENDGSKLKGKFLRGNRKSAPWVGFAPVPGVVEDVEK